MYLISFFVLSSTLGLLANIILSFILIPKFGLMGAAVGQSIVGMTNLLVMTLYGYKYEVVDFNFNGIAKISYLCP
jgi:O-antigen/teichoic acid export membrane protein